jgi:hypothetical protein
VTPRAAQIADELHASPDLAMEVLADLQIAGPWRGSYRLRVRPPEVSQPDPTIAWIGTEQWVYGQPQRWLWGAECSPPVRGRADTEEQARAAADAALVAAGWALAGGAR